MESMFSEFILITQNVDGLHRKAGSMNVLELHGNIMRNRCVLCGMTENVSDVKKEGIPYCDCSGIFRPDVVWFGESLSQKVIENACEGSKKSDLFFSIGTSAVVQPAASLPLLAKEGGSYVVEINRESTIISDYVDEVILGKSGEILPKLLDSVCSD